MEDERRQKEKLEEEKRRQQQEEERRIKQQREEQRRKEDEDFNNLVKNQFSSTPKVNNTVVALSTSQDFPVEPTVTIQQPQPQRPQPIPPQQSQQQNQPTSSQTKLAAKGWGKKKNQRSENDKLQSCFSIKNSKKILFLTFLTFQKIVETKIAETQSEQPKPAANVSAGPRPISQRNLPQVLPKLPSTPSKAAAPEKPQTQVEEPKLAAKSADPAGPLQSLTVTRPVSSGRPPTNPSKFVRDSKDPNTTANVTANTEAQQEKEGSYFFFLKKISAELKFSIFFL